MEKHQGKYLQDTDNNHSFADGTGDHAPTQSGNNLLPDIFLDPESHDSGHFTVTPDIEHRASGCSGGSSRDQSPTSIVHGRSENSTTTSLAAHLVLQACRDGQSGESKGEGNINITQSLPTKYAYSGHNITTKSVKFNQDNNDLNEHDIVSPSSPTSVGFLKTTLENFNALYQEKLQMIEDVGAQGDMAIKQSMAEKKAKILECWAKDVCVQNIVLIHTVEELEKQGIEKMRTLQQKISESTNLMKKHKIVVDSYEERINGLLSEKVAATEIHKALKQDLDKIKTEYKRIRGRVNQLEKDNDSLVSLVTRIRDMGVWDVAGLEFHKRTFSQIFELYPHLPGSEVQTVFTREKAKRIRENEDTVEKLELKVAELQNFQSNAAHSIERKDSTISELEAEVHRVVGKLQQCQDECDHYKKSLIETQEMLLHTTKELQERISSPPNLPNDADSTRHAEIQELLQELRNVKDQLNISVKESQSAKEETNMIRREFNDRLRTMQESQQCLQSEFSHSFDTHQLVREKQVELDKIKEEAQTYQVKCETTAMQLDKKDKIIEELQSTIKQLNNKIIDIKDEWNRIFSNIDQPTPSREAVLISKMSENGLPDSVSVADKANVEKERLSHQFEMEKLQLVEHYSKQLKDKDIEITMQKGHLRNDDMHGEPMSFWELVNVFDDFKVDAGKQLDDFHNANQILSEKLFGMKTQLEAFNQLVKVGDESLKPDLKEISKERRIMGHFARQIKQLLLESSTSSAKIDALFNIFHNMTSFGSETKDEIRKMEYELQLLEGISRHLQTQLAASNEKVVHLTETTIYLRREKEIAEEEALSTKIKQSCIKGANTSADGCRSMKRDLEQMKRAYLASEEIIENKNKEIAGKDALIRNYQKYCTKAQQYLDQKPYADNHVHSFQAEREQLRCEKAQLLSEKKQLERRVASLDNKVISCETENMQLKHSLQWYMNQVERVENLHKTLLRKLPFGPSMSEGEKIMLREMQNGNTNTLDTGSGDASEEQRK